MVMIHTHVKGQDQRSLGSKVRVETDGRADRRTDAIVLPPVPTRLAKINHLTICMQRIIIYT